MSLHLAHIKSEEEHGKVWKFIHLGGEKKVINYLALVSGIVVPLTVSAQAWDVWMHQSLEGVSLVTWSALLVNACIWLTYGILNQQKLLMVTYSLWVVMDATVVFGILVHG